MVVPIQDKEASTVAKNILNHWIYRSATPEQIHTDGGKEFFNKLNDGLFAFWDIQYTRTTPTHPQCNIQVKNFNCCIKDYLYPFLHDNTLGWEIFLSAMNFAYNASYQSTIGTTLFQLLYGFKSDTPGSRGKQSHQ